MASQEHCNHPSTMACCACSHLTAPASPNPTGMRSNKRSARRSRVLASMSDSCRLVRSNRTPPEGGGIAANHILVRGHGVAEHAMAAAGSGSGYAMVCTHAARHAYCHTCQAI